MTPKPLKRALQLNIKSLTSKLTMTQHSHRAVARTEDTIIYNSLIKQIYIPSHNNKAKYHKLDYIPVSTWPNPSVTVSQFQPISANAVEF